ncbi:MAG TPA: hypothetical protein VIC05_04250 [Solirubrobacteraceae bacterium]
MTAVSATDPAATEPMGARPASSARPRRERWAPSPRLRAWEIACVAVAGVALAVITSWPLAAHLSSRIAPDLGDPVRTAWQIAWVGHALLHHPQGLFDSNAFYPHPLSLAFSDSLLGYGPTAFVGSGTIAALVRYNLLFLFAWSLCFVAAYLLARELGVGRLAGMIAGAAFAYAPYRVTEAGHLHVISSGGIPLALFLLLRGYRRSSRGLTAAGWLTAAWQMSLGFTLGLQFAYLLALLALIAVAWRWRSGAGLRSLGRDLALISCAGVALCAAITVYQARPYLKVAAQYPTAKRTLQEVQKYSAGPVALLAASSENRVWGAATAGARKHVSSQNESVFFPGAVILALALAGIFGLGGGRRSPYTRGLRALLAGGAIACSILALGFGLTSGGWPYRLLYEFAPGWEGVRVPGRIFTLATLCLALLAAAGGQQLVCLARAWSAGLATRARSVMPAVLAGLVAVALVGEGAGHLGVPSVPQPARAEIGLPAPILDLPTDSATDRVWQYFSTDGFPALAQGTSTFDIPSEDDLRGGMAGFPDKASVEKLRWYGIKTVVIHLKLPPLPGLHGDNVPEPTDPAAAAAKPIAGLGVTRRDAGEVVIYEIGPGPKALHASG